MKETVKKEVFRCYFEVLSPVHIGSDEVYEPTGFIVDEKESCLVAFDPITFISELDEADKKRFSDICKKGTIASILEVYKYLKGRNAEGRTVKVCEGFLDHYKKTLSLPANERVVQQELNKFSIPRTAFNTGDQRPYIPGSSVKGALRTAWLNALAKNNQVRLTERGNRAASELEHKLMNYSGIKDDPFRLVKVSDFRPMGDVQTQVVYGINKKKKPADPNTAGLPLLFEIIEPGAVFEGQISVETPLKGSDIKMPVNLPDLLKNALQFYGHEKNRENAELARIGIPVNPGKPNAQGLDPAVMLRIGRHSGAESVTIDGHRNIFIMKLKKTLDHATTFWLVSPVRRPSTNHQLQPFGWGQLASLTDDRLKQLDRVEDEWREGFEQERKTRLELKARQEEIKRNEAERQKQIALEEEQKLRLEAEKQAAIEAMTPEERDIALMESPDVIENKAVEIFTRFDDFSEENKPKLALAFKTYWTSLNKWKKKQCTKKQWAKVQKIKAVLGEN